jgi:hypothetical protein
MTSPPPSYQTLTMRPNSTVVGASGGVTLVGAAAVHTAWSDNTDTSYVQFTSRCRTPAQRVEVGFAAPSIPAGAQIFSVGAQVRVLQTVSPAPQPVHCGWFRCSRPQNIITTIVLGFLEFLFGWTVPQQPVSATYTIQNLPTQVTDPFGNPWTTASFTNFTMPVGRDDLAGNPSRISELYVNVTYSVQSTITVTAPTGTVTTTCRPTVIWTYANTQSDAQQAYQVAIYSAAQVAALGFAPFVSTPTDSTGGWIFSEIQQWTADVDLTNGSWTAYVQVQQSWAGLGSFTSAAASTTWTQSMSGAPVAVLSSAVYDTVNNWVRLDFVPSSSSPVTTSFAVQVSRDAAHQVWGPVRNYAQVAASGMSTITAYDYEAPSNIASRYRVLAYDTVAGVAVPASAFSNTIDVTPSRQGFFLVNVFNPLLNCRLPVAYMGEEVVKRRSEGTFDVIGQPPLGQNHVNQVKVMGAYYGRNATLTLVFDEGRFAGAFAAFEAIDGSNQVLLLQYPTGRQHYVSFGPGAVGSDAAYTWDLHPSGTKTKYRIMTISITEVDAPPITS